MLANALEPLEKAEKGSVLVLVTLLLGPSVVLTGRLPA